MKMTHWVEMNASLLLCFCCVVMIGDLMVNVDDDVDAVMLNDGSDDGSDDGNTVIRIVSKIGGGDENGGDEIGGDVNVNGIHGDDSVNWTGGVDGKLISIGSENMIG